MSTLISSLQNPAVKEVRGLYSKKARRAAGQAVLEGLHPLEEALSAGWRVVTVLHTTRFQARPEGAAALGQAAATGARLLAVTDEVLDRVAETETPQGVVATVVVREAALADLARRAGGAAPRGGGAAGAPARSAAGGFLLVCDGLQDPGNLGTLWRTAHAFGADGIALTSNTAEPFSPKVIRSATGSVFHLPVAVTPDPSSALAALKGAGLRVAVADAARGETPDRLDLTGPLALVVGSEAAGPSPVWLEGADLRLRIPMPGEAESLNAGVAGAILLYEIARQRLAAAR